MLGQLLRRVGRVVAARLTALEDHLVRGRGRVRVGVRASVN